MKQKIILESWQHSPAKNLIESGSVKEWTKLLENTTCVSISSSFRYAVLN